MIKNERQYRITKRQLDRFKDLADELRGRETRPDNPELHHLEIAAVDAQIAELGAALSEYDALRSGSEVLEPLSSLSDLPQHLIRARIAAGLTQRDLADRLGMAEQQIQRYEATDWSTASLERLTEVSRALDVDIVSGSYDMPDLPTPAAFIRNLKVVGLDPAFVAKRIAPPGVSHDDEGAGRILDFAARVHRIYGWEPSSLLEGQSVSLLLPEAAGFKIPAQAAEPRVKAYTVYAHYLALLALVTTPNLEPKRIPGTAEEFRAAVIDQFGAVQFQTVLRFVWSLGIPVLPLADPGGFHGVLFRESERNVIVLKQQHRSDSRWSFDLLHEVWHASEQPDAGAYVAIDSEVVADGSESAANLFAGDVLLGGKAESLAQECVSEASGSVEFLKGALPRVARRNDVAVADLANYMAYRLSQQGVNWWGAATNLQDGDEDPWEATRDLFLAEADLSVLNPLDRNLLVQAMTEADN